METRGSTEMLVPIRQPSRHHCDLDYEYFVPRNREGTCVENTISQYSRNLWGKMNVNESKTSYGVNFKTWQHQCHRDNGTHSCHRWPVRWVLTSLWISSSFCSLSVFHRWASARASSSMWNVVCPTLLLFVTCPRPVLACARSSMFSSRSWDMVDVRSSTCACNRAYCFFKPILH